MQRWLALSIATHVLVIAAIAPSRAAQTLPMPAITLPSSRPPELPELPELIEVAFLDEPAVAHVAHATAHPGAATSPSTAPRQGDASQLGIAATTALGLPAISEQPAAKAPAPVLSVDPNSALAASQGPAGKPTDETLPSGGTTFTMDVAADGTAHLTDRANLHVLRGMAHDPAEATRAKEWLYAHHEETNVEDNQVGQIGATVATFDATDAAMRMFGQDPYAAQKLKLLDATREQRAKIGARYRERQLVGIPAQVRSSLDDIMHLPAATREDAVRALWRDCDDSKAGDIARAVIGEYVKAHAELAAITLP